MSDTSVKIRPSYLDAYATMDGIAISSTEFNGVQKISAMVSYTAEGEIEGKVYNHSLEITHRKYTEENVLFKDYIYKVICLVWGIAIAAILLISLFGNAMVSLHAIVFLIFSLLTKAYSDVPNFIADICLSKRFKSFSRFHSAEHMAAKARNRCDCAPTLEEVKKESRFDVTCSTVDNIYSSLKSLVYTIILTFSIIALIKYFLFFFESASSSLIRLLISVGTLVIISGLGFLLRGISKCISKLLEKEWFVKIFQRPLLAVPTERELELAVEAYKLQHKIDRKILHDFECYETVSFSFDPNDKTVVYKTANGTLYKSTADEYIQYIEGIMNQNVSQE